MPKDKKNRYSFVKRVRKIDIFGKQVHGFNLQGERNIKTTCGATMTMVLALFIFGYALVKFSQLESRHNPNITEHSESLMYN